MSRNRQPSAVRLYVLAIVTAGAGVLLASGLLSLTTPPSWATLATICAGAVAAICVPLRLQRGGGYQGFTFEGALMVAALFALPDGLPPFALAAAAVVGHAVQRRSLVKVAFNAGQVALWSAAGTATFHLVGPGTSVLAPRSVAAALAAVVVAELVSMLAVAELFRRLEGRSWAASLRASREVSAMTALANSAFGMLLAFVAVQSVAATVLGALCMVALYLGARSYVSLRNEGERAVRVDAIARSLSDGSAPTTVDAFLHDLMTAFGGEGAEVLLVGKDGDRVALTEVLRARAARLISADDQVGAALHREGHRDVLTAPIGLGPDAVGALAVYDRRGLEPWEPADASLLASLARSATSLLAPPAEARPAS